MFQLAQSEKNSIVQLARWVIGLSWIYQGLAPKLLHLSNTELTMIQSIEALREHASLIARGAGLFEVAFGVLFIACYRCQSLVWVNILALAALLGFVMAFSPYLLVEAFNPLTTNVPLIALSLVLLNASN